MQLIDEKIRAELIRRARDKRVRQSIFSTNTPCDWRPYEVLKPQSGLPFTDIEAWHFIADLLEEGHTCYRIVLEKPPGQLGYVIVAAGYSGCPNIYIKVTMTGSKINGRSFHDSVH